MNENPEIKLSDFFQQLEEKQIAPINLKDEVFKSLDSLTLVSEFFSLFTDKFVRTELGFIDEIMDKENKDSEIE